MPFPTTQRRIHDLGRMRSIIRVFGKYGFGEIVQRLNLEGLTSLWGRLRHFGRVRPDREIAKLTGPERLHRALTELGPTFIKFGQILSTRPDLVPDAYARELSRLQDRLDPFPHAEARAVIEEELGRPVTDLFKTFVDQPLAAASIAQVHAAELHDGTQVVVKVQRPGIQELVETDVRILKRLAGLAGRYVAEARHIDPVGVIHQFARTIRREMDFSLEAAGCERMALNFAHEASVMIPEIHWDFTSRRVLVMDRVQGIRITDFERYDLVGADRKEIAEVCAKAYLKMLLEDGCFHADPHPGNLMVLEGNRVAFVDFGMMGNVGDRDVQEFFDSFIALLNKDFDKLVDYYIRLGVTNGAPTTAAFREKFRQELSDLLEPYYGRSLKQINAADYINRVLRLAVDLHLRVPSELYLVNKVLLNLEGLLRQIDPTFDLLQVGKPYAVRRLAKQKSPTRWADTLKTCSTDYLEAAKHMPIQVRKILQKAVDDQMHVDMHITNLENFGQQMDRASNRVAFAVVTAAVIVGSSLILRSDITAREAGGISLLGLLGFTLAGTLGLWLLISILKGGRL